MERWLFTFIVGAILSLFMPVVPAFFHVVSCILVGIVCLISKNTKIASGICFGAAWIFYNAVQYQSVWDDRQPDFPTLLTGINIVVGTINDIPVPKMNVDQTNYKFTLRVSNLNGIPVSSPFLVRLNWNKAPSELKQGQSWHLQVKLKRPHGMANTGGFSYQTWLRQNHVVATGYVAKNTNNKQLSSNNSIRQKLYTKATHIIDEYMSKRNLSPMLLALSFGERSLLTPELWQVLQDTNTQHLIAISGLHLGLIATGSFVLFLFVFRAVPLNWLGGNSKQVKYAARLPSININVIAILISCLIAFYYAYLAGFSLPTIRALVMLLLFWVVRLLGVQWSLTRWLLTSVFVVILITPFSLVSASFWLSFYAVSLIFITVWRYKHKFVGQSKSATWFKSLIAVQLCLSLVMLPLSMLFNYQISVASIFANIVAVPVMSFTAIPLCLLSVILMPIHEGASAFLYQTALFSLDYVWIWLSYLSSQSWASYDVSLPILISISCFIWVVSMFMFLSIKKRYSLVSIFVFLGISFLMVYNRNDEDKWTVTTLDVGHGLSVLIEKNGKAILYDTGARYPSGFNMVESVVLPHLKHKGIKTLDKVIISHSDNDHAGGLPLLKQLIGISEIIGNDPKLKANRPCIQGDVFTWQQLTVTTLWPPNSSNHYGDENNDSCVLQISDGDSSVLLTGDISMSVEKRLVADSEISSQLKSNILIAPHHGSNTSSSEQFIKAVSPGTVIFSAAANNRWNMPSKLVQSRYSQFDADSYNTAKDGLVEIVFNNSQGLAPTQEVNDQTEYIEESSNNISIFTYRQHKWPFWFAN
jgi:competence protein ComEC